MADIAGRRPVQGVTAEPIARQRRHTPHFLREVRAFSPVFLDTEIDMTRVVEHRAVLTDIRAGLETFDDGLGTGG